MTREEAIKMLKSKMDGHTDTSYEWAETVRMAISALSENKTQMIDKSNFDEEQYKTDLQSAYDCGYNKALSENKGEWIPVSEMSDLISRKEALKPYEKLNDNDVISVYLIRKTLEEQEAVIEDKCNTCKNYHTSICGNCIRFDEYESKE